MQTRPDWPLVNQVCKNNLSLLIWTTQANFFLVRLQRKTESNLLNWYLLQEKGIIKSTTRHKIYRVQQLLNKHYTFFSADIVLKAWIQKLVGKGGSQEKELVKAAVKGLWSESKGCASCRSVTKPLVVSDSWEWQAVSWAALPRLTVYLFIFKGQ